MHNQLMEGGADGIVGETLSAAPPTASDVQLNLFTKPPDPLDIAYAYDDVFPSEFTRWLADNDHVWHFFVREAFKVIGRGLTHYSARTIIHFMRHHNTVTERGGEWKINNNWSPYLARLFDMVYPQHAGLWEYRETRKTTRKDV